VTNTLTIKTSNKFKLSPFFDFDLYFQDLDQKKKFQERDSKAIFGHTSVAHNPSKTTISIEIVGFIKNVPLNVDVGTLKKGIESQTRGSISKIHRLQYFISFLMSLLFVHLSEFSILSMIGIKLESSTTFFCSVQSFV
jgi:hypothetical protein